MKIVRPEPLKRLVAAIFSAAGCRSPEPERIAHYLVESNLVGHDSHGVIRVLTYIQWLREGKVLANRSLEIVFENDNLAVVDGGFGFGQTIGEAAVRLGIAKAAHSGVAAIALRNCGHLGRIGDWPTLAAEAGLVSLHFVNTSGLGILMAPFGGIDRRLSANPIAAGAPMPGSWPLVLDMSTSTIAEGKIRVAFNKGVQAPEGCLIDFEGRPTTDPTGFYGKPPGAILPFGGHKGYGLGVFAEILAGALTGGGCSKPGETRLSNGMLSIYLDPRRFAADEQFDREVQTLVAWIKSSRPATPGGEILMPGEIEERTRAVRREGIELDDNTWGQIVEVCQSLQISPET
jgi:hydroxycarboxylate dehydrogenase B